MRVKAAGGRAAWPADRVPGEAGTLGRAGACLRAKYTGLPPRPDAAVGATVDVRSPQLTLVYLRTVNAFEGVAMIDTMPTPVAGTPRSYLEPLAEALRARGLFASLTRIGDGPSFVEVINRDAPDLAESIFAAETGGEWWFWWSWAERIAPAQEIESTAGRIAHVLASAAA